MGWTMKKWINEERMKIIKLMVQLWKKIAIAINWKYLRKKFQWDEENKKEVNEDKMEDMQIDHGSHVTGMIYVCKIWKQSGAVALIQKKYQQVSENWHWFLGFEIKKKNKKKMVK